MKKGYIAALVFGIIMAVSVMAYTGYQLLVARSNMNVVEGLELQYWNGAIWVDLPNSGTTIDLPSQTIKAGETITFYVRVRNTAASGNLGISIISEDVIGLTHSLACKGAESTGMSYTDSGNSLYVKIPSGGSYQAIGLVTTADGDMGVGNIAYNNSITRDDVLPAYVSTCP